QPPIRVEQSRDERAAVTAAEHESSLLQREERLTMATWATEQRAALLRARARPVHEISGSGLPVRPLESGGLAEQIDSRARPASGKAVARRPDRTGVRARASRRIAGIEWRARQRRADGKQSEKRGDDRTTHVVSNQADP